MNKYDERYIFILANKTDIVRLMVFINDEWKENHILSSNRKLFEYEFLEENGTVNFMMALDKKTNNIESIIGFLKASHQEDKMDIWDVMWKTKDGNIALLGVELIRRRNNLLKPRNVLGIGDNPKTAVPVLSHILKQKVSKMNHYYKLQKRNDYKIAIVFNKKYSKVCTDRLYDLVEIKKCGEAESNFLISNNGIPYKDKWYIEHRFLNYPFYKYKVFDVMDNNNIIAIIITRKEEIFGRNVVRIVDFVGRQHCLPGIIEKLELCECDSNTEYIDLYTYGFDKEIVLKSGFFDLDYYDKNVIPDYFHPFEQRNIDIWIDYKDEKTVFYKADGDQDRPN